MMSLAYAQLFKPILPNPNPNPQHRSAHFAFAEAEACVPEGAKNSTMDAPWA